MHLINASYSDTGYYYCHDENAGSDLDLNDATKYSSVYLYVAGKCNQPFLEHFTCNSISRLDDNHLSASTDVLDTVTAVQYLDAVIPCRPTSPDVEVEISRLAGDMVSLQDLPTTFLAFILYSFFVCYYIIAITTTHSVV